MNARPGCERGRGPGLALLVAAGALACTDAAAQLSVPAKGEGTVTATYQYVGDHYHLNGRGDRISAGKITGQSVQLRLDYGLTPRLALSLTMPFAKKRYVGPVPHNPDPLDPDATEHEHIGRIDDGTYHGGWQDPAIGLRWRWRDKPWAITPFVTYSQPSHDYTFFAHSALGTRQKKLALGVFAGRQFGPRFQRLYAQGSYSYTFVEEVQDVSVDFSTLTGEVGWFFTPRFSARAFATYRKTHGGLDFPFDFPSRKDALFFNHDRVQRIDYLNYGFGAGYRINERWSVSGNWMTTGWGENGHAIHNAWTVGVSRSFD
jgi:hypothetical protein